MPVKPVAGKPKSYLAYARSYRSSTGRHQYFLNAVYNEPYQIHPTYNLVLYPAVCLGIPHRPGSDREESGLRGTD